MCRVYRRSTSLHTTFYRPEYHTVLVTAFSYGGGRRDAWKVCCKATRRRYHRLVQVVGRQSQNLIGFARAVEQKVSIRVFNYKLRPFTKLNRQTACIRTSAFDVMTMCQNHTRGLRRRPVDRYFPVLKMAMIGPTDSFYSQTHPTMFQINSQPSPG